MRKREQILESLPKNSVGAEIGVWKGDFSRILKESLEPKELHLIDPWRSRPDLPQRMYGKKTQDEMDDIYRSVCKEFSDCHIHRKGSVEAAKTFPDNYFDWVYIDGNHYEAGLDIEAWLPKAKIVCGDDYSFNEVKQALQNYDHEKLGSQWILK